MISRRILMLSASATALVACAGPTKFKTYSGPPVTQINVFKSRGLMQLMSGPRLLRNFNFELGFAPNGDKEFEGDGRTPEGQYFIDRRNPNSRYHLSIGISYPNDADRAWALANGRTPGGDIFIHGTPSNYLGQDDWTWGCIAVTNDEIEDIYAMVRDGTPITIYP